MCKQDKALDRLTEQIEELKEKIAPKKPTKSTFPVATPLPLLGSTSLNSPKREAEMLIRQIDKAEETQNNLRKKVGDFRFTSLQAGILSKYRLVKCMDADFADAMCNFPVEDPYELCFAILYLLDQDDDYAWVYSFMTGVICRAASMLPWGFEQYDEENDGFWFDDGEWIPSMPLNPEWYETTYAGRSYADDEYEPHDVSIAQIIYEHTGAILPRNMHRFDDAFRPLKKRGMKPSEANMVCALMNVLGEASRQRQYDPDIDDLDWDDVESEKDEKANTVEKENPATSEEVEKLKKELAQLKEQAKKANYSLSRENRELKEKLEKAESTAAVMTRGCVRSSSKFRMSASWARIFPARKSSGEQMWSGFRPTASAISLNTASSTSRGSTAARCATSSMPARLSVRNRSLKKKTQINENRGQLVL